jgi:hypothetical protein
MCRFRAPGAEKLTNSVISSVEERDFYTEIKLVGGEMRQVERRVFVPKSSFVRHVSMLQCLAC